MRMCKSKFRSQWPDLPDSTPSRPREQRSAISPAHVTSDVPNCEQNRAQPFKSVSRLFEEEEEKKKKRKTREMGRGKIEIKKIENQTSRQVRRPGLIMKKTQIFWCYLTIILTLTDGLSAITPILSINSPDGDIVDCVKRETQPAFSNPFLQNHTFQETPTNFPNVAKGDDEFGWQIWHRNGTRCPYGTIPIRRVKQITGPRAGAEVTQGHEYAIGSLNISSTPYIYGTKATMSVAHPGVQRAGEFSLGQIWLTSGSYEDNDMNTIEVGWQVFPELYFDHQPRLFIFWTRDAYTFTTCYNLRCPGFIQTSSTVLIEGAISPISTSGGPQSELTIQIWKDTKLDLWWLGVGQNNGAIITPVGYWPTEIFTRLREYAVSVQWGGEIINLNISGQHTTTQMGSGYLSSSHKAAYMRNLEVAITKTDFQPIVNLMVGATNPKYYTVKKLGNTSFSYGGPTARAVYYRPDFNFLCLSFSLFLLF